MSRKRICFIMVMIFTLLLPGCMEQAVNQKSQIMTTQNEKTHNLGDYLSITYTEYANGKDTTDGMVMRVMSYDLQSKVMAKLADIPYTSQYPLSVVSLMDNKIYYSADVQDKGDQLFSYDLQSKKTEQLSKELFAINYIVPTTKKGPIILAAVKKGERVLKTVLYDKQKHKLDFMDDKDLDSNTWAVSYNKQVNKSYLARFSENEREKQRNISNKQQIAMVPPDYTVVELNNETKKERPIISLKKEQIIALSSTGNQLFLITSPSINRPPIEYSLVDSKTGKRTKLDLPISSRSDVYLSHDAKGIYYLGSTSKKDFNMGRGIYYYDFATKKIQTIFLQENGFINNFMLVARE
ncbi:hypothetical protein [Brevibacillus laterosporus]|uniref:Lipoprotein n=1 Tax=Brevibacillus laterosporus TaxID=1465 RepID=A0AAP3DI37_BRELA|nr:hypothetical protein [Brevibacillus laterosporus]MBM7107343.1 hypothetical protein [Brevibacillus laterosporus]MCR8981384.1 hypothetical protein [Brevibacillus laterosporus]MCZ0808538.1 hypothetical protein [Brevibacillus laterosporus]MCZ0826895.1 hypothetical protein [Brevibacillus laterosporus]MCZ0850709.1 hypothetical protein [Brevibacillus laterosporus]